VEDRAQAAIQVHCNRGVFDRVGHRPQFLPVRKSRARDEDQRKAEHQREYRGVDSFEAKAGRFDRILTGLNGF
jgi:hypothetical protein